MGGSRSIPDFADPQRPRPFIVPGLRSDPLQILPCLPSIEVCLALQVRSIPLVQDAKMRDVACSCGFLSRVKPANQQKPASTGPNRGKKCKKTRRHARE